ncbi:hypothetical protein ACWDFH_19330 [Streptomyces kronopolitis]
MAVIQEGCLRCPDCREYVIEADPELYPDGVDYDTPDADESEKKCGSCAVADGDVKVVQRHLRTIVADWETVDDDAGCTISPDLLPVVITVQASNRADAIEAASDKLQAHFGSSVEQLYADEIQRDWWFGLSNHDPFLRISAIFIDSPELDIDDEMTTVIC